jgi:copper chaperone
MDHHFQVQGMSCGHCEMAVKKAVQRVDAHATVEIQRDSGEVRVHSEQPREALARAIAHEGYQVA